MTIGTRMLVKIDRMSDGIPCTDGILNKLHLLILMYSMNKRQTSSGEKFSVNGFLWQLTE